MKQTLETERSALVDWFIDNQMEANPGKFQLFAVGKKTLIFRRKKLFSVSMGLA